MSPEAVYASDLLETTVERDDRGPVVVNVPPFCANCLTLSGPFVTRPYGKDDADVLICKHTCDAAPVAKELDEAETLNEYKKRLRSSTQGKLKCNRDRRARLMAAGKCVCGPEHDGPGKSGIVHGPPVRQGKCQRCLDVYEAHT